jgi:hypothetical protein
MKKRETNRKLMSVLLLSTVFTALAGWTIREKFVTDPHVALIINIAAAVVIGVLFSRYLEAKINSAVDFLMEKISRVSKGDLTQTFREDPDDILPYGLSFELGRMMKYFRENVGNLWRTTTLLAGQLNQFTGDSKEITDAFKSEADRLVSLRDGINKMRSDLSSSTRSVAELLINAGGDTETMRQVITSSVSGKNHVAEARETLKKILENTTGLRDSLRHLSTITGDFTRIALNAQSIGKSLNELNTQAGLVRLNASISAASGKAEPESLGKLLDESRRIAEAIAALSQETGRMQSITEDKISVFTHEIEARRQDAESAIDSIGMAFAIIDSIGDRCAQSVSGFTHVSGHVDLLCELLAGVDARISAFGVSMHQAENGFDKLCSDVTVTLMNLREQQTGIEAIENNLRQLEEFRGLFEIG